MAPPWPGEPPCVVLLFLERPAPPGRFAAWSDRGVALFVTEDYIKRCAEPRVEQAALVRQAIRSCYCINSRALYVQHDNPTLQRERQRRFHASDRS